MSTAPSAPNSSEELQGKALAFARKAMVTGELDKKAFGEVYQEGFSASSNFFARAYVEALVDVAINTPLVYPEDGGPQEVISQRFAEAVSPLNSTMVAFALSQMKEKSAALGVSFPELEAASARFHEVAQAQAGRIPTQASVSGLAGSDVANRVKEKGTPGGVTLRDRGPGFQSLQSEAGHVPVPESLGIEQGSARKRLPTGSKLLEDLAHMFALVAMVHGKLDEQAFGRVYQGGLSASAQFFAKTYAEALVNTALHPALVKRFTPEELAARFAQGTAPLDPVMAAFATSQLQERKVSTLFPDLAKATAGFQAISQAQSGSVPNPEHLGVSIESLNQSEAVPPGGDVIVNLMMVKRALEKEGYSENSLAILKASAKDLEPLQPLLDLYARQRKNGVGSTLGKGEETKLEGYPITLSQVERGVSSVIRGKQLDAVLATLALAAWRQSRSDPGSPDAAHHRIRLAETLRSP